MAYNIREEKFSQNFFLVPDELKKEFNKVALRLILTSDNKGFHYKRGTSEWLTFRRIKALTQDSDIHMFKEALNQV